MQVKRQLEAECNGDMSGNFKIEIPEKIPQGSKKSQPDMGAFMTPNRKLAENASEYTPRNKRKGQESSPIETPGKIPRTDQINRSLFSTPTGRNTVHPPTPSRKRKGPESSPVDSIATPNQLTKTGTTDDWVTVGSPPPPPKKKKMNTETDSWYHLYHFCF